MKKKSLFFFLLLVFGFLLVLTTHILTAKVSILQTPLTCEMIGCPPTNGCLEGAGEINGCRIKCHDGTPEFDCEKPWN